MGILSGHCTWSNMISHFKINKTKMVSENENGANFYLHIFAPHLRSPPFRPRCCPPLWPRPRFRFCSFFPPGAWSWRASAPPTWWNRPRRCQTAGRERESRRPGWVVAFWLIPSQGDVPKYPLWGARDHMWKWLRWAHFSERFFELLEADHAGSFSQKLWRHQFHKILKVHSAPDCPQGKQLNYKRWV